MVVQRPHSKRLHMFSYHMLSCKFETTNALNLSYHHDKQILIPVLYNINLDTAQLGKAGDSFYT